MLVKGIILLNALAFMIKILMGILGIGSICCGMKFGDITNIAFYNN